VKNRTTSLFWGVALIAAGGLALAQTLGYIDDLTPAIWITVFAGLSLVSLVTYFTSGARQWPWLIPAGVFAALAVMISLFTSGVDSPAAASLLFVGIGLPFVAAYLQDRARNWWALIPAGVMAFLTFVLLVVDNLAGEWIGSGMFFILGLAFLLVYLGNRARSWAAIVAYVMLVMGFMPLLAMTPRAELAGIVILFAAGLPFLLVYSSGPERWWAIIPAGILLTSGVVTAVVLLPGLPGPEYDNRIANTLALVGFGATFAIVWLRHQKPWAMVVTLLAGALAIIELLGAEIESYWPLLVIAAGIFLLARTLRPQTA
jgi:hypothetical protein